MKNKIHKAEFYALLSNSGDLEIINSIDSCHYLIEKLSDFVKNGEGGKDAESYEFSVKKQEIHLNIVAGSIENQIKNAWDLSKICKDVEIKAYYRRSYVSLRVRNPTVTESLDWNNLKELTEENFKHLGRNDRDMHNWLLIIKNIPPVAKDIKLIEEQLLLWKDGPSTPSRKNSICDTNDPTYACFYLSICYFIQLLEIEECEEVSEIVHKVNFYRGEVNKRSRDVKSRARVKEWLHRDGCGFQRLRSGEQKRKEMLQLRGSVRYSSWQEARQYGEFPCISWRGLFIFFDPSTADHKFKRDDKVNFTVGFNFRGPRAVHFTPVSKQSDSGIFCRANFKPHVHALYTRSETGSHTHSKKKYNHKKKF